MGRYVKLDDLRADTEEKLKKLNDPTPCPSHGFKYLVACDVCYDVECRHGSHQRYSGCYCDYDSRGGY